MVIYEITALVRADLCASFEPHMRERHIPELLATGAFAGATLGRAESGRYRVWYEARDRVALDRYLAEHAPGLRRRFAEAFPAGVEIAREDWAVLEAWLPNE
jgi:hypothetical protein